MTTLNVNDDAGKDDFESYTMFRISKWALLSNLLVGGLLKYLIGLKPVVWPKFWEFSVSRDTIDSFVHFNSLRKEI